MNRVPGMHGNGHGENPNVPPDIAWDDDDPPMIYACSQHTEHNSNCDGECESHILTSELQAKLMNEARAWARQNMVFTGVPVNVPFPGIQVELVDLLCWLEATKQVLIDNDLVEEFKLEESYRERKLNLLQTIRERSEERIRKQRVVDSLGIVQKPGLLGPNGQPL